MSAIFLATTKSPSRSCNTNRSIPGSKRMFLRGLERRRLTREVRVIIEKMTLNVNIVAGMVTSPNGTRSEDMLHVNRRLKDTSTLLDSLLPLWNSYLEFPEPTGTAAKEKWWQEKERVNRDFEALIRDYERVQHETNKLNEVYKEQLGNNNNNNNNQNKNNNIKVATDTIRRKSSCRLKERVRTSCHQ